MKSFALAGVAAALAACATPYQSKGMRGGYSEARLDANTFELSFRGNGYTHRDRIEQMLLYRCAEVTLESGFDYFVVAGSSAESQHGSYETPGRYSEQTRIQGFGSSATATTTGTYTPGQTYSWTKHGVTAVIKTFIGPKPTDYPGAFDAREVVQYLGRSVR